VKVPHPDAENHFDYDVHLQVDKQPAQRLARTSDQLTKDLLRFLYSGKTRYSLPGRIFNLRITDVTTSLQGVESSTDTQSPWDKSGLWVSINIHGLGFFKLWTPSG
jgi:DNA helicase-2/ATP-dependent DNA helicase PcrA